MARVRILVRNDLSRFEGIIGILFHLLLFWLLNTAPLAVMKIDFAIGYPQYATIPAAASAILFSVLCSAFWSSYPGTRRNPVIFCMGLVLLGVGIAMTTTFTDIAKKSLSDCPGERALNYFLFFWITMVAYSLKAPWDDLRAFAVTKMKPYLEDHATHADRAGGPDGDGPSRH